MLQSMGLQRVEYDLVTEQQQTPNVASSPRLLLYGDPAHPASPGLDATSFIKTFLPF